MKIATTVRDLARAEEELATAENRVAALRERIERLRLAIGAGPPIGRYYDLDEAGSRLVKRSNLMEDL